MKVGFQSRCARGVLCLVLSFCAVTALAETKAQKAFLDRVKSVSTIDDAHITDDALVIWPSPDVQAGLDYEAMGVHCLLYTSDAADE